jgi:hypothetical protein
VDEKGDFRDDLLAAKERDLVPLFEESTETLDLDYGQADKMEAFLDRAWFGGSYIGHIQMLGWARSQGQEFPEPDMQAVEAEFQTLMEASASALDLNLPLTIHAWGYLGKAWVAGIKSCKAELMAVVMESQTDVAREALDWLEGRNGGSEDS